MRRTSRYVLLTVACTMILLFSHSGTGPLIATPKRDVPVGISPGGGFRNLDDEQLAVDLDRVVELGATWIRLDIDWSVIEPQRDDWSWASTDRLIAAARERGLEVLGLLSYSPAWARAADTTDKYPPDNPEDFALFAAAAAARYKPFGVHTWEIWNEPNVEQFWAPEPDPARYAALLSTAAAAIRAVDDEAFLISGGLAPASDIPEEELSPQTFLRELYENLSPGTIDAVGIHPYSFPAAPSATNESWNTFGQLPKISAIVAEVEGRRLPLWLTEYGAPYDPDNPERQSELIAEGAVCASQWSGAGHLFVYALRDLHDPTIDLQFGLLDDSGEPRPSWDALKSFLDIAPSEPVTSPCQSFPYDAS